MPLILTFSPLDAQVKGSISLMSPSNGVSWTPVEDEGTRSSIAEVLFPAFSCVFATLWPSSDQVCARFLPFITAGNSEPENCQLTLVIDFFCANQHSIQRAIVYTVAASMLARCKNGARLISPYEMPRLHEVSLIRSSKTSAKVLDFPLLTFTIQIS